jgi:hypothetical protein
MKSNNNSNNNEPKRPSNNQKKQVLIKKAEALSLLKQGGIDLESVEGLNLALRSAANVLKAEEKEVPEEFINPEKYEEIETEHLAIVKNLAIEASEKSLSPGKEMAELAPSAGEEESQEKGKITNTHQAQDLAQEPNQNRENAIKSLRTILNDLGTNYVAQAVGQSISDEFWLALEQSRAKQDEKHLRRVIEGLQGEFNEAVDAITDTKRRREEWENESLGKLSDISDFSGMAEKLEVVQSP